MLAGAAGDFNAVAPGADQAMPPLVETKPNCAPASVRAQPIRSPFASSTTPGSCKPVLLGTGIDHQLSASRHFCPSSSERYQSVIARESKVFQSLASEVRER